MKCLSVAVEIIPREYTLRRYVVSVRNSGRILRTSLCFPRLPGLTHSEEGQIEDDYFDDDQMKEKRAERAQTTADE